MNPVSRVKLPIVRIGWWDARWYMENKKFKLLVLKDGHAELLNEESEAEFYLTRGSVRNLQAMLKKGVL